MKNIERPSNSEFKSIKSTFSETKEKNVECVNHINLEAEIVIVLQGCLKMCIENVEYKINEGQGIFALPFETHDFYGPDSTCSIILFERETAPSFFSFIKNKVPTKRVFSLDKCVLDYVLFSLNQIHMENDSVYIESVLAPIFFQITKQCTFKEDKNIANDIFSNALKVINDNIENSVTLSGVARKIGCHPVTLSKVFISSCGMGFTEYLNLKRGYIAQKLLTKTDLSVTEIALEVGFGSLRNFNRTFKRFFSESPGQYRKRTRRALWQVIS